MVNRPNRWLGILSVCMLLCATVATTSNASLVAQYLFENNLNDSSGNGHTGAFLGGGGASFVVDPDRGNVLDIDGSVNSGVDIYSAVAIPDNVANTSFTLSAWAKLRGAAGSNTEEYILQVGRVGDNPLVTLGISTDFTVRGISETDLAGFNTDQVTVVSTNPVENSAPFSEWHHVAVVFNRATDTATTYIDGVPNDVDDISLLSDVEGFTWSDTHTPGTSNAATIGTEGRLTEDSFNGLLDDIRFYDHALTDNQVLVDLFAEPRAIPILRVNRNTGAMSLENSASATDTLKLRGYSITSALGALDQAEWKSIADNYDEDSGTMAIDGDDAWTVLSDPALYTDLSEFQFAGTPGDGATIAVGSSIDLSQGDRTWLPNVLENDLVAEVVYTDGTTEFIQIVYEGNGGNPLLQSDLNHSGLITIDDWLIFKANNQTNMSSLTLAQARLLGDLDQDLDSDINDFLVFQSDYDDANGPGSFTAMLQSVPEPSSILLLGLAGFSLLGFRGFRGAPPMRSSMILAALIFSVSLCSTQQVKADVVAAQFEILGTTNGTTSGTTLHKPTGVDVIAGDNPNFGDITYKVDQGAGLAKVSQNDGMLFANMNEFQYNAVGDRNIVEVAGDLTNPGVGGPFLDSAWFAISRVQGGGSEDNADIAATYFPFADGWISGHVAENGSILAGNTGAVTITQLPNTTGSPGGGFFELSIAGVNTFTDGLLFTVGGENSNSGNFVSTGSPDSSKWSVVVRDQGQFSSASETGEWSFVYIPYDTKNLVAAASIDISGIGPPVIGTNSNGALVSTNSVGNFTLDTLDYGPNTGITPPGGTPDGIPDDGRILLKIDKPGGGFYSDADGMLMLNNYKTTQAGAVLNKADGNMVAWEYDATLEGFVLESYTMLPATLEDSGFAFAFFEYDNPIETSAPMKLLVHPGTGEMVIFNPSGETIDFNAYQINSPAGALLKDNADWNSLDDQDFEPLGVGEGENWDESGGVSANTLSELFLLASSDLAPGESISLGNAYNLGIGDVDMSFKYSDVGSSLLVTGDVEIAILGDMDGNGILEDADINPFVEALTNRSSYVMNNPGVLADIMGDFDGNGQLDLGDVALFKAAILMLPGFGTSVPEPSAGLLLVLALVGLVGNPSRKKRTS